MIIARTPYRTSFMGGGTDERRFYSKEGGAVLSTAINKYIFNFVGHREDSEIRALHYEGAEEVADVEGIKHPLIKQALKLTGVTSHVEIGGYSSIRAKTGLGSSGSYIVGALNALHTFKHDNVSAEQLAREACKIEIDILERPVGKQDQYIAAYGGFRLIEFKPDEEVSLEYLNLKPSIKRDLKEQLMLFDTGMSRDAATILTEQREHTEKNRTTLRQMKYLAFEARDILRSDELDEFGRLLHKNWELKKQLATNLTNGVIDAHYQKAIDAGALGGKILGAGGGGYLLFYVPLEKQDNVRKALIDLKETKFDFEPHGSQIVYIDD